MLTSKERAELRARANTLDTTLIVGKEGVTQAVADALQIPVKFIGVGEQADDLMPFEARPFVEALL